MRHWWLMFAVSLIYPFTMVFGGLLMKKVAGRSMNGLLGYRSRRSMMNDDTWRFANEYCGKQWLRIGWLLLILITAVQLPFYGTDEEVIDRVCLIISAVSCSVMLLSILPTEKALKATFNENGSRK